MESLRDCLISRGHTVIPFFRSSAELDGRWASKIGAFFSGVYNPCVRREFARLLDADRPDVVHINNLFPLISPSILDETKRRNMPTVMTVHNYRLLCPTGLMFSHGEICHRCLGGREWWCAVRNCADEWPKSAGYALRNAVTRMRRSFLDGTDLFVAPTEFVKSMLVRNGYPAERIQVMRHIVSLRTDTSPAEDGGYVGYVGRISPEKGIDTIVESARECPDIEFRFAGHYRNMPELPPRAPLNCKFIGQISSEDVATFVSAAKFTVFASRSYETAGLSLVEAMARGKAVICSRIGCLTEIVEDGVTGLLFVPGDASDLAAKIRYLWERPELCRAIGEAGRQKVLAMFSPEANYVRLLDVYRCAIDRRFAPADSSQLGKI